MASDFNKFEASEQPSGNPFSAISRSLSESVNEGVATRLSGMRTAISEALSTITPSQWEKGGSLPRPITLPSRWVGVHTIASCSGDKTVRVWNAEDGTHLRTLKGHSDPDSLPVGIAFSSDGRTIVSGSEGQTVRLWNAQDGTHLRTWDLGHSNWVAGIAFSPDGRTIASCSSDKTVRVWNAQDGTHLRTLEGHSKTVRGVAFSPDGRTIASFSDDTTVRVWNAEDGRHLRTLEGHSGPVSGIAFSPTASLSDEGQRSIGTLTTELRDAGFTAEVQGDELSVRWPAHPA